MQALKPFTIPLKGLEIGIHEYDFKFSEEFFLEFDNATFSKSSFLAKLTLDKRSDLIEVKVLIDGFRPVDCDRCTDSIDFPIQIESNYLIKYSEDEREDMDVIYIHPESTEHNCAKVLYDIILLSKPISMTCDLVEGKQCNEMVIKVLHNEVSEERHNPLAEGLKNLKID